MVYQNREWGLGKTDFDGNVREFLLRVPNILGISAAQRYRLLRIVFISVDINYQQGYIDFQCSPLIKDRQVGLVSSSILVPTFFF